MVFNFYTKCSIIQIKCKIRHYQTQNNGNDNLEPNLNPYRCL